MIYCTLRSFSIQRWVFNAAFSLYIWLFSLIGIWCRVFENIPKVLKIPLGSVFKCWLDKKTDLDRRQDTYTHTCLFINMQVIVLHKKNVETVWLHLSFTLAKMSLELMLVLALAKVNKCQLWLIYVTSAQYFWLTFKYFNSGCRLFVLESHRDWNLPCWRRDFGSRPKQVRSTCAFALALYMVWNG